MSSFGAGGGSVSGSTGGQSTSHLLKGLGLDQISQLLGQNLAQGAQQSAPTGAIQPGREAAMSPQQRLAQVMRQYSGGQG